MEENNTFEKIRESIYIRPSNIEDARELWSKVKVLLEILIEDSYNKGKEDIKNLILKKAKEKYSSCNSYLVLDDKGITEIMKD